MSGGGKEARVQTWTVFDPPPGTRLVSMDCCGFTFDSGHEDMEGGYSCPACAEIELRDSLLQRLGTEARAAHTFKIAKAFERLRGRA